MRVPALLLAALLTPLGSLTLAARPAHAQAPARTAADSVRAVVARLFDGMRAGDSTAVRAAFHPGARLTSAFTDRTGAPRLEEGPISEFVTAVGTPHDQVWDERVDTVEVRVDAAMATAWVPYRFYAGAQFSHCGVNSFQLWRGPRGWAIVSILDMRRRAGCAP